MGPPIEVRRAHPGRAWRVQTSREVSMSATTAPETQVPSGPRGPGSRRTKTREGWRNRLANFDRHYVPYLLVAPFFVLFLVFGLFPLVFNGVVAFRNWRLDDPD